MQLINSYLWFRLSAQSSGSLAMPFHLDYEYGIILHCISFSPYPVVLRLRYVLRYDLHTSEASYQPDLWEPIVGLMVCFSNLQQCTLLQVDVHRGSALQGHLFSMGQIFMRQIFHSWNLCHTWEEIHEIVHTPFLFEKEFIHLCYIVLHTQFSKYMLYFPYQ